MGPSTFRRAFFVPLLLMPLLAAGQAVPAQKVTVQIQPNGVVVTTTTVTATSGPATATAASGPTTAPAAAAAATAVTVHKIDDTVVAGDLLSVSAGKVTVGPTSRPVEIPLTDVLVMTTPATVIAAPPLPQVSTDPSVPNQPPVVENQVRADSVVGALILAFSDRSDRPAPAAKPATAPVSAGHLLDGTFELANGDHFQAGMLAWTDKSARLQILNAKNAIDVPAAQVTAFWTNDAAAVAQAKALAVDSVAEDVAYVRKDAEIVPVKGIVKAVAADGVVFRYDDKDRKIDLKKIVGLSLRSNPAKPDPSFHQVFRTTDGAVISGTWTALHGGAAVIQTWAGQTIQIPMTAVVSVSGVNGRVVYLSDWKPSAVVQTPYFGRVIPYRMDQSLDGGTMTMADGPHARGIAVHSYCQLGFDLTGDYDRFKSDLGFDLPGGKMGRVAVRVIGDDKVLFERPDLRGDQPPVAVDVDVKGVKRLVLEVDFGADQDTGDRVDWAEARVTRAVTAH
jgi:hypothetical protein